MRVLAIDTALGACAAAIYDSDHGVVMAQESREMTRGHAEALMPMIARVMDAAMFEFAELDRVAVTVGPGSFTGLRVGLSAARGIALAAGRPAVGVSTLAAYAAPAISADKTQTIIAAIDARHAQVFIQIFGPGGRTLAAARQAKLSEGLPAIEGPVHLVGSAAEAIAQAWPADAAPPSITSSRSAPDIEWVAKLGVVADTRSAPPNPLYLRPPDAQPQHAARLPRQ
ncbi:MAG: tRNA (adenosine(37)-N6)-threonylcarbamoyltransferase complex dimerization subunit type 1 TsaB [Variibacter sp.]